MTEPIGTTERARGPESGTLNHDRRDPLVQLVDVVQNIVASLDIAVSTVARRLEQELPRLVELEERSKVLDVVRCRRIVVVEDDGFERITLSSEDAATDSSDGGAVVLHARPAPGQTCSTYVKLLADDDDLGGPWAGVFLSHDGNTVGSFDVIGEPADPAAVRLAVDHVDGLPGLVVDVEGVKNAPMRLYRESER